MSAHDEMPLRLPFRSPAAALIFCILCGPVGLLYASLPGGVVLMVAGLFLLRAKVFVLLGIIWLIACVWGVAATQRYNERLLKRH